MIYLIWDLAAHEYYGPFLSLTSLHKWAEGRISAYGVEKQSIWYPNHHDWAYGWTTGAR